MDKELSLMDSFSSTSSSSLDDSSDTWECSVCTYRNSYEAFKCVMCETRKRTYTRKPRINPEMVVQQVVRQQEQIKQQAIKAVKAKDKAEKRKDDSSSSLMGSPSYSGINVSNDSKDGNNDNSNISLNLYNLSQTSIDSTPHSVKRRKREHNSRKFDSKYFFDSVFDQIESKYRNTSKDDPIIDFQNLELIDKKGFVEKRPSTEFGYFAENTLEDLRTKSLRNKDLISCPSIVSTLEPKPKQSKVRQLSVNREHIQRGPIPSTSTTHQLREELPLKKSMTNIMFASDDESDDQMISSSQFSDQESIVSNQSEELDESHPFMKYENRNLLLDKDYQISCFKKTIEILKNDKSNRSKKYLEQIALKTFNLPALPSGNNVVPIIRFDIKGRPNFEFYFLPKDSPLDAREVLQIDYEIICVSKTLYEWICLP